MSSLHEKVAQRRAAESADLRCVSAEPGGSALIICQWQGQSWVLPWSQFVSGRLCGADADSPVELHFANYLVTVTGENLRVLLDDLAAPRVGCLRDLPGQYRRRVPEDAPYIARIDVESIADAFGPKTRESS